MQIDVHGSAPLILTASGSPIPARGPTVHPAPLRLDASHGAAKPPPNLGARMVLLTDPLDKNRVLDQYLYVWFTSHPAEIQLTLQIDDAAAEAIHGTWGNPGDRSPALVKVDSARIPGDGLTHRLTVAARALLDGAPFGPPATVSLYAKTPNPKPNIIPEWVSATLLRQTTDTLVDLSEIRWRHPGAVMIVARIPVRVGGKWGSRIITVAHADHHEAALRIENLGGALEYLGPQLRDVAIGIAAIAQNRFGPITWAARPLKIRAWNKLAVPPPADPDAAAGTAEHLMDSWYKHHVRLATLRTFPPETAQKNTLINTALQRLFLKIKEVIHKGGSVAIDDFGRFEARWNDARTVRGVGFVPGPGFKEGTRTGLLLRDDQVRGPV